MIIGRRTKLIERYLAERMNPGEKQRFEQMLQTDVKLRSLLAEEQAIVGAMLLDRAAIPVLEDRFPDDLYKKLSEHPASDRRHPSGAGGIGLLPNDSEANEPDRYVWKVVLASLAILLAILLLFLFVYRSSTPSPQPPESRPTELHTVPAPNPAQLTTGEDSNHGQTEQAGPNVSSRDSSRIHSASDSVAVMERSGPAAKKLLPNDRISNHPTAAGADAMRDNLDREESASKIPVIRSDSARMKIKRR